MIPGKPHRRRSIRLRGYDYSQPGMYFVTICAADRDRLFGEVANDQAQLNDAGRAVQGVWAELSAHYAGLETDAFVVMPNHVHGILILHMVGAGLKPAPTRHGVAEIVRGFKTFSARRINEHRGTPGIAIWQRNYYEHIIRNGRALDRIRQYIAENPARWAFDRENPQANQPDPETPWADC